MSTVTVTKDRYTVESLYQWDKNQKLIINGLSLASIPEIHFTNATMDKAIVRQSTMDGAGVITADIPNSLLQKPHKITAYVCVYDGNTFESLYSVEIPVNARPKPNDYTFETDTEVYSFNALENLVINVAQTSTAKMTELNNRLVTMQNDINTDMSQQIEEIHTLINQTKTTLQNYMTTIEGALVTHVNEQTPSLFILEMNDQGVLSFTDGRTIGQLFGRLELERPVDIRVKSALGYVNFVNVGKTSLLGQTGYLFECLQLNSCSSFYVKESGLSEITTTIFSIIEE